MLVTWGVIFAPYARLVELGLGLLPRCLAQLQRLNLGEQAFRATAKKVLFDLDGDQD